LAAAIAKIAGGVVVLLVVSAAPAGAVTPGPSDYRSSVVDISPRTDALTVRILGGDAVVELTGASGREVVVLGYEGEPYLRVLPDGRTEVNQRSPAVSLNRARTAAAGASADADANAPPEWLPLGADGTLRWHDHRVHAMTAEPVGSTTSWRLPVTVDGEPVSINGELTRLPTDPLWPWVLAAAVLTALAVVAGRRHPGPVAVVAAFAAGVLTLTVGLAEWLDVPADVGRTHALVLLPLAALVLAAVAVVLKGSARVITVLASVALEGGWLAVRWRLLTAPLLVGPLPTVTARALVTVAAAATLAAAVLTVLGGELALPTVERGRLER
jgi:hypothetical protein